MEQAPCISQIASLLAEPKRTAMLWALMDGSAKSSHELATLVESAIRRRLGFASVVHVEVKESPAASASTTTDGGP